MVIAPLLCAQRLTPTISPSEEFRVFQENLDISGSTLLFGVSSDDPSGAYSGSAYYFNGLGESSIQLGEQATLQASDGEEGDGFGSAVSLFGTSALVGASSADDDGNFADQGVAYYFRDLSEDTGIITENAILAPSTGNASDLFSSSISLWGNSAVVGSRDQLEEGKAYYFRDLDQATGTKTEDLTFDYAKPAGELDFSDRILFGYNVALQGDLALISAPRGNDGKGAAYLYRNFTSASGTVTENAILTASDGNSFDRYAESFSINGNLALVGDSAFGNEAGKVYLYRDLDTATGTITESAWLDNEQESGAFAKFGYSISLSGSNAIVGAPNYTINGSNQLSPDRGAAYLYTNLDTATGRQVESVIIKPNVRAPRDRFGGFVHLEGDRFSIVGLENKQVYQGNISSLTTFDEGNTNGTIKDFSFASRTDWIIGETTSGNTLTLEDGSLAAVDTQEIYVGKNVTSNDNHLILRGDIRIPSLFVGSKDGNSGNTLRLSNDFSFISDLFLAPNNRIEIEGDFSNPIEIASQLGNAKMHVWDGNTWLPSFPNNFADQLAFTFDAETGLTTIEPKDAPTPSSDPIRYDFIAERISSSTKDGTTLTFDQTTDIEGSLEFDFLNLDITPEDSQVGTYLPTDRFSLGFTSSNISNRTGTPSTVRENTILTVRNNLAAQLSPEQIQGADVIDINIGIERSFGSGSDEGYLNLQLIDSTGTALDSDELPDSLDFSKFDTILLFHERRGFTGSGTFAAPSYSNFLTASVTFVTPPPTLFRFTVADPTYTFDINNREAPPITLLQGGWTIDYTTPDYAPSDPTVGLYVSGISSTPAFTQPGQPENFLTEMNGFAFGGDGSEDDLTSLKFLPLAELPNSYTFVWKSPTITVTNGTFTTEEILGQTVPTGSDTLLFTFERFASTSRGGDNASFSLLLADPTGQALFSDDLPTQINLEDFAISQVFYKSLDFTSVPSSINEREQFEISGPLTSFGIAPVGEVPTLTVSAPPVNEGLIGYPVTFTLSAPAQGGERFSFALEPDQANVGEDFLTYLGFHEFNAGETSLTLTFTLLDDAVIEPDESFNLVLSNAVNLQLVASVIPLTILNDDTLLDDYGSSFGLSVEERMSNADGDADGLPFIIEYGFNLDPTSANQTQYTPGLTYSNGENPTGLPVLIREGSSLKYIFPRRTDAAPRISYSAENSTDGALFIPATESKVTPLTEHWEEVEIELLAEEVETPERLLIRVRFINNEE